MAVLRDVMIALLRREDVGHRLRRETAARRADGQAKYRGATRMSQATGRDASMLARVAGDWVCRERLGVPQATGYVASDRVCRRRQI